MRYSGKDGSGLSPIALLAVVAIIVAIIVAVAYFLL